ncbi:hypothetical protein SARC_08494, partial [Sphaeroforma arctica JP610]
AQAPQEASVPLSSVSVPSSHTLDSEVSEAFDSYEADLAKLVHGFDAPAALDPFQEVPLGTGTREANFQLHNEEAPMMTSMDTPDVPERPWNIPRPPPEDVPYTVSDQPNTDA